MTDRPRPSRTARRRGSGRRISRGAGAAALLALLTAGCSSTDKVSFVTSTVVGLDADSRTQSTSIGYGRLEGVFGPAYQEGALPPVFAKLESNLSVFRPEIRQLYATGDAARIVAGGTATDSNALAGKRRSMFFGTATFFGLQLGFGPAGPQSGTLGYKRIEYSRIPVQTRAQGPDIYPPVLASIKVGPNVGRTIQDTGMALDQFFATGDAAEALAPRVAPDYQATAKESLAAGHYAPDVHSHALEGLIGRAPACQDAFVAWAEARELSPLLLLTAAEYADQRKQAYEALNANPACRGG